MSQLLEKLSDNAPLALAILGVLAFVLGAATGGGLTYEKFTIPPVDPLGRWALMLIGAVVAFVGLLLLWAANYGPGNTRALTRDYGFRIEAPGQGQRATSPVEVRGTFKREPPAGLARVLEYIPVNGTYWPKSRLVVNRQAKSWSVKFEFGGATGQHREFIVALCGPAGSALFDYHQRAGKESGKWVGIQTLPSDVVLGERVYIEIG